MPNSPAVMGSSRPSSGRLAPRRLFDGSRSRTTSSSSSSNKSVSGGRRFRGGKWLPMILAFFGGAAFMSIVMATFKVVIMHGARLPSHPATPGSYWLHPVVKDLHTYPIKYIAANSLPRKVSPEFLWSSPRISSASCGAESCYRRRGNHDPGKCRQNGKEAALVLIRRMHANHSHATPVDGSDTSSRGGNRDGSSSDGDGGGGGGGGRRVVDVYVPWALRQPPCTVTVRYLTGGSGREPSVPATLASATSEGGHVRFHAAHLGIYAIYYRGFYSCGKNCWMDDCPPSRRRRANRQLSTRGGSGSHDDGRGYAGLTQAALAAAANRSAPTTSKRDAAAVALATATTATGIATRLLGFATASVFDRRAPFEFLASHAQQQKLLHSVMRARQHATPLASIPMSFASDALLFALPLVNVRRDAVRCHFGRLPWSVVAYYTDWTSTAGAAPTSLPHAANRHRGEGGTRWSRGVAPAAASGGGDVTAADEERDRLVHPLLRPHVSVGPVRSGRAAAFQLVLWRHGLKTMTMRIRREQQLKLLEGVEQEQQEQPELEQIPPLPPPPPPPPPTSRMSYYKVTIGPCEVDDSDAAVAGLQLPWMCIRGGRTTACNEPSRGFESLEGSGSGVLSAILVTLQVPSWDWLTWRGVPATAEDVKCRAAGQVSIDDELVIPFSVDLNIEKWQPRTEAPWLSSYCGTSLGDANEQGEAISDDDAMRLSWLTSCPYCGDDNLVAGLTPIQRVGVAADSEGAAAAAAAAAAIVPWELDIKSRVPNDIVEAASISATPRKHLSYEEHLLTVLGRRVGVAMPSTNPDTAAAGMASLPLFSRIAGLSDDSNVLATPPSESPSSQVQGPLVDAPASFRVLDASGAPLRWVGTNRHFRRDPLSNRESNGNDGDDGTGGAGRGEAWSWQYQARSVAPSTSSASDAEQSMQPPPTTSLLASISASLGVDGVIEGTLELRVVGQAAPVAAAAAAEKTEAKAGPLSSAIIGDVQLRARLSAAAVPFAAGAGLHGGFRPAHGTDWRWRPSMVESKQKGYAPGMGDDSADATWDNMLWVGSPTSGLKLTLLPSSPSDEDGNSDNYDDDDDDDDDGKQTTQLAQLAWKVPRRDWPDSWHNNGRGGIRLTGASPLSSSQDDATVDLVAYSGARALLLNSRDKGGVILSFHWRAVVTPVRPFDASRLFAPSMRRFHVTGRHWTPPPLQELMGVPGDNDGGGDGSASGGSGEIEKSRGSSGAVAALTLHHGTLLNPYINYPFHRLTTTRLQNLSIYIRQMQRQQGVENDRAAAGLSIYYTLRELSNHATELPLLPTLGDAVLVGQWKQKTMTNPQFPQQRQQHLLSRPGSVWLSERLGFQQEGEDEKGEDEGTFDGDTQTTGGALYTPAWTTLLRRARGGELLPDSESDPGIRDGDSQGGKPASSTEGRDLTSGSKSVGGSSAVDNAVAVHGTGPWVNHFVQGARWLSSCGGVGGFYLDSVAFDRRVMRRFRRAAEQGCEASLVAEMPRSSSSSSPQTPPRGHCGGARGTVPHVDLHCNNKTVVYLEYLPYVDSLWVGELLDFFRDGKRKARRGKTKGGEIPPTSTLHSTHHLTQPDYFLVTASGIPFGVPSQLLSGSLSPYGRRPDLYFKALLFGMTDRAGWAGTGGGHSTAKSSHIPPHLPALWRLWDDLGFASPGGAGGFSTVQSVAMHGWWTNHRLVRVQLDAKGTPLEEDLSPSAAVTASAGTRDRFLATAFVRCAALSPPTNEERAMEVTPLMPHRKCRATAALIVVADWPRPIDRIDEVDSSAAFDLLVAVDLQGLGFGAALEQDIAISAPIIPTIQPDPPKVTPRELSVGDPRRILRGRVSIRVKGVTSRSSGALIVLKSPGGGREK